MNTRVFAVIALLGYDYLCTINMSAVISGALLVAWLAGKTIAMLKR
jgi:hypothetical protein